MRLIDAAQMQFDSYWMRLAGAKSYKGGSGNQFLLEEVAGVCSVLLSRCGDSKDDINGVQGLYTYFAGRLKVPDGIVAVQRPVVTSTFAKAAVNVINQMA
jgi:hypothetical protein